MRTTFILLIIALAFTQCERSPYETAIDQSRDSITVLMEKARIPGLAVTVMIDGEVIWSEGFGHADIEQDIHVDPSRTRFRIGSISKSLTAFGLARLYEQKKIFLDSSVYHYYPDYPKYQYRPTVRQVAGHLAGIRHYRGDEWLSAKPYQSVTDGLSIFSNDSLLFRPGERFSYTSYGFNLLSAVMEKAAGKEYLRFMNTEVFTPLQLLNTSADRNDSVIYNRSRFYEVRSDQWVNAPYVDNSYKWAGGGFISTSEDIARFGNALLQNELVTPETIRLFTTPQTLNDGSRTSYGIGFGASEDYAGKPYFGHSGGSVGGTSDMVIYPDEKIVVVVLTNLSSARLNNITQNVAHIIMQK